MAIGANAKVIVASLASPASGEPVTIVRNRGQLAVMPSVTNVDVEVVGAYGMGIVSNEAFAAGVASVPGPWTDGEWEGWMVWQPFAFRFDVASDIGRLIASVQIEIDSKAMRKFEEGNTLIQVVESEAAALKIAVPVRSLILFA